MSRRWTLAIAVRHAEAKRSSNVVYAHIPFHFSFGRLGNDASFPRNGV
jgi:hypothetical protein